MRVLRPGHHLKWPEMVSAVNPPPHLLCRLRQVDIISCSERLQSVNVLMSLLENGAEILKGTDLDLTFSLGLDT